MLINGVFPWLMCLLIDVYASGGKPDPFFFCNFIISGVGGWGGVGWVGWGGVGWGGVG